MKPINRSRILVFWAVISMLAASVTAVADDPTLPNSGTTAPRTGAYDPGTMASVSAGADACTTAIEEGWGLVDPSLGPYAIRRLEGEVVAGHLPFGDFQYNHNTEDYNFFVHPDVLNPLANDPSADYRTLLGAGNFETGEPKEWGLIEVEWEYGAHSWNDAADSDYYGFPSWAWPNLGDRVIVEGWWTFDCGHDLYRTEIHPPWFVATFRNAAQGSFARGSQRKGWLAALGPDDRNLSRTTRVDVFISSYGGEATDNIFDDDDFLGRVDWWMPVNSRDYEFDIPLPVAPSNEAEMVLQIFDPPSDYIPPPDATHPSFGMSNLAPFTRADGRTVVHVTIPMSQVTEADYMTFAKTIVAGWDVPEPEAGLFHVTFDKVYIWYDMEDLEAEWNIFAHSGDRSVWLKNSDGWPDEGDAPSFSCDSDANYSAQCEPDEDENNVLVGSFYRFLTPDEPLVVSVRAHESDISAPEPWSENDDCGWADAAYTAAESFGIGSHFVRQSDWTWSGESHDDLTTLGELDPCDGPDGSCYEVAYHIERLWDPTATTPIDAVQYAQDPNHFQAMVVTPGPPDKPRRKLPVVFSFVGGGEAQGFQGTTGNDGVAAPSELIVLPGGDYQFAAAFLGNGLLLDSAEGIDVTVLKDYTDSFLTAPTELRWGHNDAVSVQLIEPNVGQGEPPFPVVNKPMFVRFTGLNATEDFAAGPTDANGNATITPLMLLPPGNYQVVSCFTEDPWFLGSCSAPQTVKITPGYGAFASGGGLFVTGRGHESLGDLHSETDASLSGSIHRLSDDAGERIEYGGLFSDGSSGSTYNQLFRPAFGVAPQYYPENYCNGSSSIMGVPVTQVSGNWTISRDTVLSGIYCVDGNLKIQARVSGVATIVATGLVSKSQTSGGDQNLTTADPTGADVLILSKSTASTAIEIVQSDGTWTGAVAAPGGVAFGGRNSKLDGIILGGKVSLKGSANLIDGR